MVLKFGRENKVELMQFLSPLEDIDILDAILEGLALFAYLFVLLMAFYAKKNNRIFASKGFLVLISGIVLGTLSAGLDFFTEFYWIDNYEPYKLTLVIFQIVGLLLFAISLMILFRFTKFLMGEDGKNSDS
nr:hypothetical protein DSAG12_00913 [Candidatus Prometheoarchaeum syntrophicum]